MHDHLTPKQVDRFWSRVDRSGGLDACWPWLARRNDNGYGCFDIGLNKRKAHRVAFLLTYGHYPHPCGLHTCDNPPCCNPRHIVEGTRADNLRDMHAKGRARLRGEDNGNAYMTEGVVRDIRRRFAEGERQYQIAAALGINYDMVWDIVHFKSWRHV